MSWWHNSCMQSREKPREALRLPRIGYIIAQAWWLHHTRHGIAEQDRAMGQERQQRLGDFIWHVQRWQFRQRQSHNVVFAANLIDRTSAIRSIVDVVAKHEREKTLDLPRVHAHGVLAAVQARGLGARDKGTLRAPSRPARPASCTKASTDDGK